MNIELNIKVIEKSIRGDIFKIKLKKTKYLIKKI